MQKKNSSNFFKKIFLIFIITLTLVLPFIFAPTYNVKASVSDSLLGTWKPNEINTITETSRIFSVGGTIHYDLYGDTYNSTFNYFDFRYSTNEKGSYMRFQIDEVFKTIDIYNSPYYAFVANQFIEDASLWDLITFTITDVSHLSTEDSEVLLELLQANATKEQEEVVEPDIASGEYRVNYNYSWPLTETVEFTGGLTYNDVSYGSLFMGPGEIYLLSYGTTATQKNIMNNYQWLVSDFTFTAPDGLYNTDDIHNAVESFTSQVNGTEINTYGLQLDDLYYSFKPTISYDTLGRVEFTSTFETGINFDLSYNYMYYSAVLDTLYYGGNEEENIVYQNGVWKNSGYKNFYYTDLITNYAVGTFLAQNLDINNITRRYLIQGYYYFNSYIDRDDLAVINTLNSFPYVFKGNIYNGFEYNVLGVQPNPSYYQRATIKYINSNTIGFDYLMDFSYSIDNTSLTEFPTLAGSRQIYISPTYVNHSTYEWLNNNGLFIYVEDEPTTLPDLILVFPDVLTTTLANVLNFEVFGINLFKAIGSIIAVSVAWFIIKKLL